MSDRHRDSENEAGNKRAQTVLVSDRDFACVQKSVMAMLSARSTSEDDGVAIVGRGIGLIKFLKALIGKKEHKDDARKLACELVKHLSSIELNSGDERSKKYISILEHYRVEFLGDEKRLVEHFDTARRDYLNNSGNGQVCLRFGWVLHDCLKVALRLRNVKLVQYFGDELVQWKYTGTHDERDGRGRFEECRMADINKAKEFLAGPIDAITFISNGEWGNALRAAEIYLQRNPRNAMAFKIAIDASCKLKDYDKMCALCLDAVKRMPSEDIFQRKLIQAVRHVYWSLTKDRQSGQEDLEALLKLNEQKIIAYDGLMKVLCEAFPLLNTIAPQSTEYSKLLDITTRITVTACAKQRFNNANAKMALSSIAVNYISFVKEWGLGNFTEADKACRFVHERRYASLASRVVFALLGCFAAGNAKDIFAAEPWVLPYAIENEKLCSGDISEYCRRLANAYFCLGDMEKSRAYALRLVRENQNEDWRWRVLGRTYPKDSQERGDCMAHAISFEQCKSNAIALKKFEGFISGQKPSHDEIRSSVDDAVGAKAIQNARAEGLLMADAVKYDGIVLTRFDDRRKGDGHGGLLDDTTTLRVWWRDEFGTERTDFVSFARFDGVDASLRGAPVSLLVVANGEGRKVVKVYPRLKAKQFDIYPYRVGLVVEQNASRHTITVMYGKGMCCPVNVRKINVVSRFDPGQICQIALFERAGMVPLFLDIKMDPASAPIPSFAKEFDGLLLRERGHRDAHVGDVIVPSGVYTREMLGKDVHGVAAPFTSGNDGLWIWRAVTLSTLSKDLEVRP